MNKAMKWFFGGACACVAMLAVPAISGVFYPDGATTMHFAFEGSPNGDRPIVRPPAFYRADDGFGFVDSPTLVGTSRGVTAPSYFRFDVNIPPGTYDVTVITGGTAARPRRNCGSRHGKTRPDHSRRPNKARPDHSP
jgi:hypothetical protein